MIKSLNEYNCESTNTSMMGQKFYNNTISTFNNISMYLEGDMKEDFIRYSHDSKNRPHQIQQNVQKLNSVIEEDSRVGQEHIRNASNSLNISEEEKNQSTLQINYLEKTRNLIEDLPIKKDSILKMSQNQYSFDGSQNDVQNAIQISKLPILKTKKQLQVSPIKQISSLKKNLKIKLNSSDEQIPPCQQNNIMEQHDTINLKEVNQSRKISEIKISCKICLDEEGPFLTPCKCSGSCSYVHEKCLIDWILSQQKNKKKIKNVENKSEEEKTQFQAQLPDAQCEICQYNYKYQTIYQEKFSLECLMNCNQSTHNFSIGFITFFLSCFMIFLIVMMFTNSPFGTSESKQTNDTSSQENKNSNKYSSERNQQPDTEDEDQAKQNLQYTFLVLSLFIITLFFTITFKCCKKAIYKKRIISCKILEYGQEVKKQIINFKNQKIIPDSIVNQTKDNIAGNKIHQVSQTQVRSQTSRALNNIQALRILHNNTIPIVQSQSLQSRVANLQQVV